MINTILMTIGILGAYYFIRGAVKSIFKASWPTIILAMVIITPLITLSFARFEYALFIFATIIRWDFGYPSDAQPWQVSHFQRVYGDGVNKLSYGLLAISFCMAVYNMM